MAAGGGSDNFFTLDPLGLGVDFILETSFAERICVYEALVAKRVVAAIANVAFSRPGTSTQRAREGSITNVVAVGTEHLEALMTKSQLVTGYHHAQVRLWDKQVHHAFGSIELLQILLDRIDIAISVEGTSHITTCTEARDDDIVARLGELA